MQPIKIEDHKSTEFIAHRGLSGMFVENTVSAFNAAGKQDYFGIESDVHVTRDGKFIIFHDDTTKRLCPLNFKVEKTRYATLRLLPVKLHRMPNLEEYIECCANYKKTAVLELKNPMSNENVKNIVSLIDNKNYLQNTIFISFDGQNLEYIRKIKEDQPVQFLASKFTSKVFDYIRKNMFDLDIRYTALHADAVKLCHDNGIKVNCWTVDDPDEARKLIDYGVDYLTTDILI